MFEVEHVLSAQADLGEGPVWHPQEQVLYFLDINQNRLHRFDPVSGQHSVTELGFTAGSMGVRAVGGWVMATKQGFGLRDTDGQMTWLGDPGPDEQAGRRFNDGKTDPSGRFWAGKMGGGQINGLYRLDGSGTITQMESGIGVSNGLGWSPNQDTFYYTDSATRKIYAYAYDAASGAISDRRDFVSIAEGEGSPDGLAVDSEGCVWSARWQGWKVVRYAPDGQVLTEIAMPVELPTSCAFGGPNLDELYITSAYTAVPAERRAEQPLAGDLFRVRVGVRGLPEPIFRG